MKIAIEAQRLFREKKHGMEIVAQEIIRELQQIDKENEYTVYVKNDVGRTIEETSNFHIETIPGLPYPIWEQFSLTKKLRQDEPDILHCTANTAPLATSIPLVITIHDVMYMESFSFKGTNYQNFGNIYRRLVVPAAAKKSRAIITVSNFEKENISKTLKIHRDKIHVIYNGLNANFNNRYTEFELNNCKKRYGLPDQFLFHIGNPAPRKNSKGVLIAYSDYVKNNHSALPLVISGCDQKFVWQLIEELKLQDLKKHVKCTGYLSIEDLPLFYNLATLFLYPSFREGFGMPVVESMACGTPVITGNNSSLIEVANGCAVLVDASAPQQISKAIWETLDKNIYSEFVQRGLENARRFNWKKSATQTLEIYKSIK